MTLHDVVWFNLILWWVVGVVSVDWYCWTMASTSEWAEYRILCADSEQRHRTGQPTVRAMALVTAELADRMKACGPHTIGQKLITRTEGEWTDLLDTDPQTSTRDAVFAKCRTVDCPRCPSPAGEDCINLSVWNRRGGKQLIKWPHPERMTAVGLDPMVVG